MFIRTIRPTPEEIEGTMERHSQLVKEFAAICESKDSQDVFYALLSFFCDTYAKHFGEERRAHMFSMIGRQLFRDMIQSMQDQPRSHFKECQDCRPGKPCQFYFKLVDRITDVAKSCDLRVNADGSFDLTDNKEEQHGG